MRILSILLIESDLKWWMHLSRGLFLYFLILPVKIILKPLNRGLLFCFLRRFLRGLIKMGMEFTCIRIGKERMYAFKTSVTMYKLHVYMYLNRLSHGPLRSLNEGLLLWKYVCILFFFLPCHVRLITILLRWMGRLLPFKPSLITSVGWLLLFQLTVLSRSTIGV